MKFGSQLLDEIKTRIKVSDIVSKKIKLAPRGNEFVGLSPFSNEKTPSFTVSDEKGFYHCFSSGEHGSIFDFVMKTENLSFREAVKKLADYAGIKVDENIYKKEDKVFQNKIINLRKITKLSCDWYHENLKRELKSNKELISIFKERNFNENIINNFSLGFAPKKNDTIYNYLKLKGFSSKDIIDSGVVILSSKNNQKFDRFNNRIIFPIYDYSSNVVGFGGKAMSSNQIGKYVNSSTSPIFKKGDLLFGWQQCKNNNLNKDELYIVEGYTDVISMHNAGYKNVIAPLGTALTIKQIICAWRITKVPTICMDGDEAGQKASKRVSELVFPHLKPGYSLNFVKLPVEEDPDSLILSNKTKDLDMAFDNKISLVDYIWNNLVYGKNFNTPEKRAELEEEISRLVNLIDNFIIKKNYKNFFREKFFNEFKLSYSKKNINDRKEVLINKNIINTDKISERILLGSVILYPDLLKKVNEKFFSIKFSFKKFELLKNYIYKIFSKKLIEKNDLRATLLKSEHKEIVSKIINKSILLHAPFLKSKNNIEIVFNGWNEYYGVFLEKKRLDFNKKNADITLNELNKENYEKFRKISSLTKKK